MRAYLKFLSRNKVYTLVNVVGLSVSLAFVIIIGLYAQMEFGRDKWHEKADRIYSLFVERNGEKKEYSHWCMQQLLKSHFPEIESSCSATNANAELQLSNQEKKLVNVMAVDSTFFQMFDFPLVEGSRAAALQVDNAVVLTEETARMLFADSDPIGKDVVLNDSLHLVVTGVMKQLNHTYMKQLDMIVTDYYAGTLCSYHEAFKDPAMRAFGACRVYLLAREGADLTAKQDEMNKMLSKNVWIFKEESVFKSKLRICPLTSLYFDTGNSCSHGDRKQSWLLLLAGIVILLFAVMNYVNLTIAQSGFRMREMAMRRLMGAQRWNVAARLMAESVMLCLLSLMIAIVLVYALEPAVNMLICSESRSSRVLAPDVNIIQVADIWQPLHLLLIVGFTLLLGMIAGLSPAIVTSSAKPIEVVRGTFRRMSKMYFSRVFITIQHVVTIVFIAVALTMWLQMRHLIHAPLGYDTENLLVIEPPVWNAKLAKGMGTLHQEIKKLAGVTHATIGSNGTPLSGGSHQLETFEGHEIETSVFLYSEGWLKMMGIKVITDYGTSYKSGQRLFVTPSFLEQRNLPADTRAIKFQGQDSHIDGLIESFTLGDILSGLNNPIVIMEDPKKDWGLNVIVKYKGDLHEIRQQIAKLYEDIIEMPMAAENCVAYEDLIANCYSSHIRILRLVTVFAVIAIIVSLLGLLAMSTYYIQQRRKEVAVRKVFGSTSGEVLVRLLRRFMTYVAVAFVIAIPIIYYIANDWLSQFSYRIGLSIWIFIAAGFTCFIISLLTVLIQSWLAANENPINHIKTE